MLTEPTDLSTPIRPLPDLWARSETCDSGGDRLRPDMWLSAPNLLVAHGFSTRAGGVSQGPYAGLNLDDREDAPDHVQENRLRALGTLGFRPEQAARLTQVHGCKVVRARPGPQVSGPQTADAQVTDDPELLLVIGTADCFALLLEDAVAGVVGAAHAGWRGTVGGIAARTVEAMTRLGARPENIRAAIGPGICAEHYPVGPEVAQAFVQAGLEGALVPPPRSLHREPGPPRTHLDLAAANQLVLEGAGVPRAHIWQSARCSFEPDFYSYRRDLGKTGRMWAAISVKMNES